MINEKALKTMCVIVYCMVMVMIWRVWEELLIQIYEHDNILNKNKCMGVEVVMAPIDHKMNVSKFISICMFTLFTL